MIVTTHEQWVELYNAIRDESRRSEEKHIFIYASSSDCDSVCALRILEASGAGRAGVGLQRGRSGRSNGRSQRERAVAGVRR